MPDFLLPDLGEGLDEAEIIAWRVQAGDHVTVDQVIAEVETAKAVVELPVPPIGAIGPVGLEDPSIPGIVLVVPGSPIGGIESEGVDEPPAIPAIGAALLPPFMADIDPCVVSSARLAALAFGPPARTTVPKRVAAATGIVVQGPLSEPRPRGGARG